MDLEEVEEKVKNFLLDTNEYQNQILDVEYKIETKTYMNDLRRIIDTEEVFIRQVKLIIKLLQKFQNNTEKNIDKLTYLLENHNRTISDIEKKLEKVYARKFLENNATMRIELDFMIDMLKQQLSEQEQNNINLREDISILNDIREQTLLTIDSLRFDIIHTSPSVAFGKSENEKIDIKLFQASKTNKKFKKITKNISSMMKECFEDDFEVQYDKNIWLVAFIENKIAGFLTIDKYNTIWNVCVAKKYRLKGVGRKIISEAIKKVCSQGKIPVLKVDKSKKTYEKLITMYKKFGFSVKSTNDHYTTMKHDCK
jgi:ribosomal protein S18 acetylase RimI-like enzyme